MSTPDFPISRRCRNLGSVLHSTLPVIHSQNHYTPFILLNYPWRHSSSTNTLYGPFIHLPSHIVEQILSYTVQYTLSRWKVSHLHRPNSCQCQSRRNDHQQFRLARMIVWTCPSYVRMPHARTAESRRLVHHCPSNWAILIRIGQMSTTPCKWHGRVRRSWTMPTVCCWWLRMYLSTYKRPSGLLETICAESGSQSPSARRSLGEDGTGPGSF